MGEHYRPDPNLFPRVSYHAVTRYCQRILGVELLIDEKADPYACALAHARAAGSSVDEIRAAILSPPVVAALSMGAKFAHIKNRFSVVLDPTDGVVVTINPPGSRLRHRAVKQLSRRESRKMGQAHARRRRRNSAARSAT